jgi:hypothetical protein
MDAPDTAPHKLAAARDRIFGGHNTTVSEARARVIDTMNTGVGTVAALDALERAVEKRAAERIRRTLSDDVERRGPREADQGLRAAAALLDPEAGA